MALTWYPDPVSAQVQTVRQLTERQSSGCLPPSSPSLEGEATSCSGLCCAMRVLENMPLSSYLFSEVPRHLKCTEFYLCSQRSKPESNGSRSSPESSKLWTKKESSLLSPSLDRNQRQSFSPDPVELCWGREGWGDDDKHVPWVFFNQL